MIFTETPLRGAFVVEPERREDQRGFFARTFAVGEFSDHRLATTLVEESIAWTARRGTLRGLHFQYPPFAEVKLVRCTRGAVYDVIVDLRPESPTWGRWFGTRLDDETRVSLYVPERFAHGYQTLVDDCEVEYAMSTPYAPDAAAGIRFDDPALAVPWPLPVAVASDRDLALPTTEEAKDQLIRGMTV